VDLIWTVPVTVRMLRKVDCCHTIGRVVQENGYVVCSHKL